MLQVKERERMDVSIIKKKVIAAILPVISILILIFILHWASSNKVIGTIRGAEFQQIVIGDTTYKINGHTGFSIEDQGQFLGWVTAGNIKFRIYSVKGDREGKYLYRLWDWEGAIYEKEQ